MGVVNRFHQIIIGRHRGGCSLGQSFHCHVLQGRRKIQSNPLFMCLSKRDGNNLPKVVEDFLHNSLNGTTTIHTMDRSLFLTNPAANTDFSDTPSSSPVDIKLIDGRCVYIKRDDLLFLPGSSISGNKARKFWSLHYRLNVDQEFPFGCIIISYGGPQSNAMVALATFVHHLNQRRTTGTASTRFVYYTKALSKYLKQQSSGNLHHALSMGMELVEVSHEEYQELFGGTDGASCQPPVNLKVPTGSSLDTSTSSSSSSSSFLWVPQGGALFELAYPGAHRLAHEIMEFWSTQGEGKPLSVVIPGGTCTTAVLVHHAMMTLRQTYEQYHNLDIQVLVVPCVGDADYAKRQMTSLLSQRIDNDAITLDSLPNIVPPTSFHYGTAAASTILTDKNDDNDKKIHDYFRFGVPHPKLLNTFRRLHSDYNLLVDLLYGSSAWTILLRHWHAPNIHETSSFDPNNPIAGREVMYVHSGGLEGIETQLGRYKFKGIIGDDELTRLLQESSLQI